MQDLDFFPIFLKSLAQYVHLKLITQINNAFYGNVILKLSY